jgi:hypothetical protein
MVLMMNECRESCNYAALELAESSNLPGPHHADNKASYLRNLQKLVAIQAGEL